MRDPRVQKLAHVLVRYSLRIQPGDLFRISANAVAAPLVREVYREALLAGANPITRIELDGLPELMYRHLALGASYPETGGHNHSAIHWDMVCDLCNNSEVTADGQVIYRNGRFLV